MVDLNEDVGHVAINEPYSLRVALAAENHPLAIGVVHSHPEDCAPRPSSIDDDMDNYYGRYFEDFAPSRPYVSLIFSQIDGQKQNKSEKHRLSLSYVWQRDLVEFSIR